MEKIQKFVQRYKYQIVLFIVLFVAKTYLNTHLYGLVQNTGNDEIGTIAGATLFSQLDWTDLVSKTSYYGFGYSILMTPILNLINDTVLLHQVLLMYNTICVCICAIICFNIQCRYLLVENKNLAFFIALASVTFENNMLMTNVVANEPALILILWITIYLLLYLKEKKDNGEKNKVIIVTLFLSLILIYGLLIHTRIIYIWGATVVFIIAYAIHKKKCLINVPAFIIVFAGGYIIATNLIKQVQSVLWRAQEGEVLNNSIQSLNGNLGKYLEVFTWDGFKATAYTVLGEIWGMVSLTGGLFAFALVLMVISLVKFSKIRLIEKTEENFEYIAIAVTALYVAILGSVSLGAADAIKDVAAAGDASKWYMYVRYTALVIGPIIMLTLVYLTNKIQNLERKTIYFNVTVLLYMFIEFAFLLKVAPKFIGISNTTSGEYLNYSALMGMEYRENFLPVHFIRILIISSLALGLMFICIKKNKKICISVIVISLNVFTFSYVTVNGNGRVSQELYALFEQTEEYIKNEWELNPDTCSITVDKRATSAFINSCQFTFREWSVDREWDNEENENQIVFSAREDQSYYLCNYKLAYVNENETSYMFIKGNEIEEKAINSGLTLISTNEVGLDTFYTNGELVETEEGLKVYSDEEYVIYGPYIALESGTYKVTWEFETDKNTDLEFGTGVYVQEEGNFEDKFSVSSVADETQVVSQTISLDAYTDNIELKIYLPRETEIQLCSVRIEQIND